MFKLSISRSLLSLAFAFGAGAGAAHAATIQVYDMNWSKAMSLYIMADGVEENAWAGAIRIRLDNTYNREAFCVDLFTNIYLNQTYNTTLWHADFIINGPRAAWLMNEVYPTISSPAQGAALQIAIWDIIHDSGDGLAAGRVQAATKNATPVNVTSLVQTYLAMSLGQSGDAWVYQNVVLNSNTPAQMLMSPMTNDGGPTPNPEPGTVVMMAGGLALVAVGLKRRRRTI